MHRDDELTDAIIDFFRVRGGREDSSVDREKLERLIFVVVREVVLSAQYPRCQKCGKTRREHIINALRAGGKVEHNYAELAS